MSNEDVPFVVLYENADFEYINVNQYDLRTGDHVARIIAGEMKSGGRLPQGKVGSVKRA